MTIDFQSLANPGVRTLHPYVPGKPISELERELGITNIVKLASNENPLGISPKAKAAIEAELKDVTLYPDANGYYLKEAYARKFGLEINQLTLGNGSNDVLDLAIRAYVAPGEEVVCSQYCFVAFPISAQAQGAVIKTVPAKSDYGHDLDAMAAAIGPKTKLVYVVNPNNPTGNWLKEDELKAFLAKVPANVLVVYDEAYFEYAHGTPGYPNAFAWLKDYPNLIVLRTFSKAYGLAALRVGFAISHADCAGYLNRVRQPFNVNSLALAAGVAVIGDDDYIARSVANNTAGMRQISAALEALGLPYIPSLGNFVCFDCQREARPIYEALLREGVIVRPLANYGLTHHLRVSIGTEAENQRFIEALKKVY
ncbi:MAG: histidinol-phosphate transaminase [Gammaproteobacteria bacterium]|nr:histidinol-phosphate transaminase [Gammaproteobacteria bacterium]